MLLVLVPAYGALASRVNRTQLVQRVTLFFASNLLVFLAVLAAGWHIGIAYFLWLGIFNLMVIAQFWAFAADVFSEEQGKRLFPLIGVGSSLGAWLGSLRAGRLVESAGAPRLLVGGAVVLVVCTLLVRVIERVARRASPGQSVHADAKLAAGQTGFRMLLSDRYLTLIAVLVVLLNVVNASGEYIFGRYVVNTATAMYGTDPQSAAARQQFIGQTYSSYFSYINLIGFLLQLFLVSRVFKFLGVARSLLIHPIVSLVGYVSMLRAPSFEVIRWLKIADNSLDYSLGNTTKQALWLPTSREAKYKAKQAVDAFCVRAGDVLTAGVVYTGELASFTIPTFAALNIAFVLGWLATVRGLNHKLQARARKAGRAAM
jgi:AAA family ATP:ADP antiporter